MGQTAATGVQDGLPRGYQPERAGPPVQLCAEDGTWKSPPAAPAAPPSRTPAKLPSFSTEFDAGRPPSDADVRRTSFRTDIGGAGGAGGGSVPGISRPDSVSSDIGFSASEVGFNVADAGIGGPPPMGAWSQGKPGGLPELGFDAEGRGPYNSRSGLGLPELGFDDDDRNPYHSRPGHMSSAASSVAFPETPARGGIGGIGGIGGAGGRPGYMSSAASAVGYPETPARGGGLGPGCRSSAASSVGFPDTPGPLGGGAAGASGVREEWEEGSIVEAYSATTGRWYPARVMQVVPGSDGEVLTVQFYVLDEAKQKSVYRSDPMLALLGSHTAGELPPGFLTKPSQSRPGQLVYQDVATGTRYASSELAWRVHFERLLCRSAEGMETVAHVPSRPSVAAAVAAAPSPLRNPTASLELVPRPLTLAELEAGHMAPAQCRPLPLGPAEPAAAGGGKVALPSFGEAVDSQAAYLGYVGAPGPGAAAAPVAYPEAAAGGAGYPSIKASAPRRPIRTSVRNPALQVWQEDPFSEWRR